MTDRAAPPSRRPLTSRNSAWAKALAVRAVARGLSPNQISQLSIASAVLGAACYAVSPIGSGVLQSLMLILAAAACQARLVCNLIDGLVAVEGGQGTKDGPFWNEAPDRLSDLLLLGGAGVAAGNPALGFLAAALAIATAYIRELGRAEGVPPDFSGPMAKPQRMAAVTIGTLIAAFTAPALALSATLWVIIAGTAITAALRSRRLIRALKAK